jgi:glycerol kinase
MALTGIKLSKLRVDGGASANSFLMQFQSDQLGVSLERHLNLDSTALGAAYLAGLGVGFWDSLEELKELNPLDASFQPKPVDPEEYNRWKQAVKATIGFIGK